MAQPLLHQRQQLGIVRRLGIDHPVRRQPRLVEAWREQIAPPHHPQHRAPGARGDTGEEQGGGGVIARMRGGGGNLVQRIQPEAAIPQPGVERLDPEGQHLAAAMPVALDGAEGIA